VNAIVTLVQELAGCERAADECHLTRRPTTHRPVRRVPRTVQSKRTSAGHDHGVISRSLTEVTSMLTTGITDSPKNCHQYVRQFVCATSQTRSDSWTTVQRQAIFSPAEPSSRWCSRNPGFDTMSGAGVSIPAHVGRHSRTAVDVRQHPAGYILPTRCPLDRPYELAVTQYVHQLVSVCHSPTLPDWVGTAGTSSTTLRVQALFV
jgi:hypothetical protein